MISRYIPIGVVAGFILFAMVHLPAITIKEYWPTLYGKVPKGWEDRFECAFEIYTDIVCITFALLGVAILIQVLKGVE